MPPPFKQDSGKGEEDNFVLPVPPPAPSQRATARQDEGKQLVGSESVGDVNCFGQQVNRVPDSRVPLNVRDPKQEHHETIEDDALKWGIGATEADRTTAGITPGETRMFCFASSGHIQMCWIPPGHFLMGSPAGASCRVADESPHLVKLSKGFWISKYPVTQGQWFAVMATRPSTFGKEGKLRNLLAGGSGDHWDALPVESVSWMDICGDNHRSGGFLGMVNLSATPGWRFDLPSESQWEYACRAGTTTDFNNGCDLSRFAIWSLNLLKLGWLCDNSDDKTHPVGRKIPNAWGLHDMHGNVWEWCSDYYADYPKVTTIDPSGPLVGVERVNRGGCWASSAKHCRSAFRSSDKPEHRSKRLGFRLILRQELQEESPRE